MPIVAITGLPGHGKTLHALARYKAEAEKDGRPVFHNGIKGLNIPGWQVWDAQKWQDLPAGALMIIDEAQDVFPIRGRGQPDPWIEALAKHRHLGIDIVLITQSPMLVDSFVRRLVDRHFHVVRKFGTQFATIHEFANGCRDDVHKNRKDSIRHEWRYPKEVFEWYTSAEKHTVKRRIPMRVYVLLCIPFIFLGLAYLAYSRLNPEAQAARAAASVGQDPAKAGASPAAGTVGGGRNAQSGGPMTLEQYFAHVTPRVPDFPHTAPAYDEVTKPVHAPYPAACMKSASFGCRCYTQQATRMEMADAVCLQIVERGFFVAWETDRDRSSELRGRDGAATSSTTPEKRPERPAGPSAAASPARTADAGPAVDVIRLAF